VQLPPTVQRFIEQFAILIALNAGWTVICYKIAAWISSMTPAGWLPMLIFGVLIGGWMNERWNEKARPIIGEIG